MLEVIGTFISDLLIGIILEKILLPIMRIIGASFRFIFRRKGITFEELYKKPHNGLLGLVILSLVIILIVLLIKNS